MIPAKRLEALWMARRSEDRYMNSGPHGMQYSVALKCDDHGEQKHGYLTEPQFSYLQSGAMPRGGLKEMIFFTPPVQISLAGRCTLYTRAITI